MSAASVRRPSFLAAFLTEIYLCGVCFCHEVLRRNGHGRPGPVPPPAPAPTQMAALQLLFVLLMKRRAPVFAETQPLMDAAAETRLHSRILRTGAAVLQTARHGETAGTGRAAEEGCRLRVRAVQLLGAVVAVRREIAPTCSQRLGCLAGTATIDSMHAWAAV